MLDCDKVLKAPMSLSRLNSMNATLTLNAMNANLTLNANSILNVNLTLNATNACTTEHSSVISTDNKSTSMNAKVVTTKSITSNCMNSKLIYDTTVRSRYVKFLCYKNSKNQLIFNGDYQHSNCLSQRYKCEREPSRIPAKKICRLLTKSRMLRKAFRKKIKRDIPDSSCVHPYTQAFSREYQRVLSYKCFDQFIKTNLNWKTPFLRKSKKDAIESRHLKFNCNVHKKKSQQFYNNVVDIENSKKTTFKDLNHNHRVNYCKLILCGDIETNPGPTFNNPGKTIHAPYSQGNVDIFGENAGRQCVPMSLCSLIYFYRNSSICDSSDLTL